MRSEGSASNTSLGAPQNFMQRPKLPKPPVGPVLLLENPRLERVVNFIATCSGMAHLETKKLFTDHVYDTASDLDAHLHRHIAKRGLVVVSVAKPATDGADAEPRARFVELVLDKAAQCSVPALLYVESPEALHLLRLTSQTRRNIRHTILGYDPKRLRRPKRAVTHLLNAALMTKTIVAPQLNKSRGQIIECVSSSVRRRKR